MKHVVLAAIVSAVLYAQPLTYNARTDLTIATGAAPTLGIAGTTTIDPDFHSRVLRVTQSASCGATAGLNYFPNDGEGWRRSWNADSTKLLLRDSQDGTEAFYITFDPDNFTLGSCVQVASGKLGKSTNFAWTTTNRIYGFNSSPGKSLAYWDTASGSSVTVFDMTTIPGFTSTSPSELTGDTNDEWFCANSGAQDVGRQIGCYNRLTTDTQVLNLATATAKQNSSAPAALDNLSSADLAGCVIHTNPLTKGATPWVWLTLNSCSAFPVVHPSGGVGIVFWQLGTSHVTYIPDNFWASSHAGIGFGAWINNPGSISTCGTYSQESWWLWNVANVGTSGTPRFAQINPCQSVTTLTDNHQSWENNVNDANVNAYPMVTMSTAQTTNSTKALEWEIDAVETGLGMANLTGGVYGTAANGKIWRLAHSYNDPIDSQCPEIAYISPNVSRDGKFVAFSSDWGGQTGSGSCTNSRRLDVFVVDAQSATAYIGSHFSGMTVSGIAIK